MGDQLMRTIVLVILMASMPLTAEAQGTGCFRAVEGGCCCRQASERDLTIEGGATQPARTMPRMSGMTTSEHANIFNLLTDHGAITRVVEEIPGGVRTTTTTNDPTLVETLRTHVRQMAKRVEEGRAVWLWDPPFREVFEHHDEITLAFRDIDNGIEVVETSENPDAVEAIRAHARRVDEFVERGHAAARPPWARGRGRGPGPGVGRGPGMGRGRGAGRPLGPTVESQRHP